MIPWHCSSIHVSFAFLFLNLLVGFSIKFCTFSRILLMFQFSQFVAQLQYVIRNQGLLCWSVFAKDVVGCFCYGSVKAIDQGVYFCVLILKGEEWSKLSPYGYLKISAMLGSLSFSRLNLILVALVFHPLETESEGHHYKLMTTSKPSSWKAPRLCNVHT